MCSYHASIRSLRAANFAAANEIPIETTSTGKWQFLPDLGLPISSRYKRRCRKRSKIPFLCHGCVDDFITEHSFDSQAKLVIDLLGIFLICLYNQEHTVDLSGKIKCPYCTYNPKLTFIVRYFKHNTLVVGGKLATPMKLHL